MWGRFLQPSSRGELARRFAFETADDTPELFPRYNVAPTQIVTGVRLDDGPRALKPFRWGLVPSWAKDPRIGNSLIIARSETVAEKPAFRAAFKARRCLIPTAGFYEWVANGGRHKQPYHLRGKGGQPFALAGLWELWREDGQPVETCTILTTEANGVVRRLHDRMPVVVAPGEFAAWLDPHTPPTELHALLRPYPADEMGWFRWGATSATPGTRGRSVWSCERYWILHPQRGSDWKPPHGHSPFSASDLATPTPSGPAEHHPQLQRPLKAEARGVGLAPGHPRNQHRRETMKGASVSRVT
jgi:putative SOS response-associated peptidase YedK